MAFIKDYYNAKFGITISDCYWKIENENGIIGGKEKLRVRLNCFKSKAIADTNKDKLADFDFIFTPNLKSDDNFIVQAYNYAKTLPEFKGAVDA